MKCYTFSIEIDGNRFHFEYMNEEVFYLPYGRKEISTYSLNYGRIEVPQIWIITRKSGCPLFALEPTEDDENKFDIMTAQYLYDEHESSGLSHWRTSTADLFGSIHGVWRQGRRSMRHTNILLGRTLSTLH